MSTEIATIQGQHQAVANEQLRLVDLQPSDLYVKTFSGGAKCGKMVNFHIHQSDGTDASIQITPEQALALVDSIRKELDKIQIVVLNEHTLGYRNAGDNFICILKSLTLKGANFNESDGRKYLNAGDTVRLATPKDFEEFRISMDGYKQDPRYEFDRG